jgi:hypothetical protein
VRAGSSIGRLAVAAGFFVLSACAGTPPDSAAAVPSGGDEVRADLTVLIARPYADSLSYTLTCGPTGASLEGDADVDPREACAALGRPAVRERLIEGPPPERACTLIYGGPEQAFVTGTLDGTPVDTRVFRNDGCGISDWDRLLGDILVPVDAGNR